MIVDVTPGKGKNVKPYPKLMVGSSGRIVLFTSEGVGTALNNAGAWEQAGYFSKHWTKGKFKDFEGSITLSND